MKGLAETDARQGNNRQTDRQTYRQTTYKQRDRQQTRGYAYALTVEVVSGQTHGALHDAQHNSTRRLVTVWHLLTTQLPNNHTERPHVARLAAASHEDDGVRSAHLTLPCFSCSNTSGADHATVPKPVMVVL